MGGLNLTTGVSVSTSRTFQQAVCNSFGNVSETFHETEMKRPQSTEDRRQRTEYRKKKRRKKERARARLLPPTPTDHLTFFGKPTPTRSEKRLPGKHGKRLGEKSSSPN
jgi:hypothetical protein